MNWDDRKTLLLSLNLVDDVIPQDDWNYKFNVFSIKPEFVVHGDRWSFHYGEKVKLDLIKALDSYGGKLIEIPYTNGYDDMFLSKNQTNLSNFRIKTFRDILKKDGFELPRSHSA